MGYNTDFSGQIEITPAATPELIEYIRKFSSTRRIKRDNYHLAIFDNNQNGFEGKYGTEGEFYVGGSGEDFQNKDATVVNYNEPPSTQPGLWCQWVITNDGKFIEWDGNEKFYNSVEWMQYIIDNFLAPKGHKCNGVINAVGDEADDVWNMTVTDNVITTRDLDPTSMQKEIDAAKSEADKQIEANKQVLKFITNYKGTLMEICKGDLDSTVKVDNVIVFLEAMEERLK